MQNWFVVVMGLCTVFVVLTLIILLCYLLGAACRDAGKEEETKAAPAPVEETVDRGALAAAVGAAVAEYSGTSPSAIRIVSMKKI